MNTSTITTIPAELWVGNEISLCEEAVLLVQKHFCKAHLVDNRKLQNCFCSECKKIKQHQHSSLLWLCPQKNYSVNDIDIIFNKISFQLDEGQKFFFILQKANLLSVSSANKLLKILEEPPLGYHSILLTNNQHTMLSTIISRCILRSFTDKAYKIKPHPLLAFFLENKKLCQPKEFEQMLNQLHISESESLQLVHILFDLFAKEILQLYQINQKAMNKESNERKNYLEQILGYLKQAMRRPPQSGSSAIFWKNLYLAFPKHEK